jgi:hypothetical protein
MKRFFLLILSLWKLLIGYYFQAAILGAVIGLLVFFPIYEILFFLQLTDLMDENVRFSEALSHATKQLIIALKGKTPLKTSIFVELGIVAGLFSAWLYRRMHNRLNQMHRLRSEVDVDIHQLISMGETDLLEFKSSYRWDLAEERINKNLENVILKTIAGFFNSPEGGTLLIGVADDGTIIGLEYDYSTLKRPDSDGFEQLLISAISSQFGADLCQNIKTLFHVIDNKHVCRLIILPSSRPVYIKQGKEPKFFLRTGGGTRELNIQEAVDYIIHRWPKRH